MQPGSSEPSKHVGPTNTSPRLGVDPVTGQLSNHTTQYANNDSSSRPSNTDSSSPKPGQRGNTDTNEFDKHTTDEEEINEYTVYNHGRHESDEETSSNQIPQVELEELRKRRQRHPSYSHFFVDKWQSYRPIEEHGQ